MTPAEVRRYGREVVDWVADYLEQVERFPVLSQVAPGEIRGRLPESAPQQGEPFEKLLCDLNELILPGITHWQSPNFFAFFPANNSFPSILGELASAGLGVQGMLWATSPACTELETHVLDWLVEMLGLPASFRSTSDGGGVIQDSASSASLCALLAARERVTGSRAGRIGLQQSLTGYASLEAHSSIDKALMIAGLGSQNLRRIPTGPDGAMDAQALDDAIRDDRGRGRVPCLVTATIGTTSTGACDSLREVGPVCQRHGVWLHVDAAMAGTAALCEEFRDLQDGLELADSYCFNPHKWMLVNFDCDCFYVRDRQALTDSLSVTPEYLRNTASDSGRVIDYRDWQIPLGRRFRALKLWFVIRSFGVEGLQQLVREHVHLAQELAGHISNHGDLELLRPPVLNLVCFRHRSGNAVSQRLLDAVNQSGAAYLTHTVVNDQMWLRVSVGQASTRRRHVERLWQLVCREAARVAD